MLSVLNGAILKHASEALLVESFITLGAGGHHPARVSVIRLEQYANVKCENVSIHHVDLDTGYAVQSKVLLSPT